MCTQKNDARRSASRIDLIISQFERRRAPSSTGAVLREILEPHSADAAENFSSTKSYRAIDNSVSVSESDSYSNSESDSEVSGGTEQWKSIAGWKLPISKSELISEVVVRVAVEYWQCAGRHLLSNIPPVTLENLAAVAVVTSASVPRMVTNLVIYPSCRLVFGTLYPAYASYKAVRTKNVKEYVKWMMYWIVFALFTCAETVTDVFFSWFPFYYEVKILLVLWLLSPATKGSSILYRKFVHPALCRREQEIDEYISKAKDQGYHTVLNLGTKGVNYATNVIMQTAIKNFAIQNRPYMLPSPRQPLSSVTNRRDPTPDVAFIDQVHYGSDITDGPIEISSEEGEFMPLVPKVERDDIAMLIYREENAEIDETPVRVSRKVTKKKASTGVTKRPRSTSRKTRNQAKKNRDKEIDDDLNRIQQTIM